MSPLGTAIRKIDLTRVLEREGKVFVRIMRQFLTQGKGVDFGRAQPLAESTLAARRRRGNSSQTRLKDTGALYAEGFVIEAAPLHLEVGLSDAAHPRGKGASYDQIGAWNQAGVSDHPWVHQWFGVPETVAKGAVDRVGAEIERQLLTGGVFGTVVETRVRV